ncbi:MAG: hypothetical protein HY692_02360 [Cyanobacteria bacterium NC_groundwater_1444_Ag_S-0.65um_54_12]|nr:hypothetical protein [Cyanobacteria bacterium NC_groundwater_1444_Ag_S-0.65um_54_12]
MKAQELIHQLGEMVIRGFKVPFVHYTVLQEDRILDLLEELELSLPEELLRAQEVIAQREHLFDEARRKADDILQQAKQQARVLVSESEIVKQANSEAERMQQEIAAEVQRQQAGADSYADEILAELEAKVSRALSTVQNGRQSVNAG